MQMPWVLEQGHAICNRECYPFLESYWLLLGPHRDHRLVATQARTAHRERGSVQAIRIIRPGRPKPVHHET